MGRPLYFTPVVSMFFLLFFLANSQRSEIGCLPYFNTRCYIGADVECMSEMCCTQLAKNTGRKNYASAHHCTTLLGYIFVPQTAQNGSGVWGTPATPTSLSAGQPNFARCLAISWAGTLYRYIFGGSCPDRILPGAKFTASTSWVLLYWQRYCTALNHWASTKLCGVQQRAPPIFSRAAITLGIGLHSSLILKDPCRFFEKAKIIKNPLSTQPNKELHQNWKPLFRGKNLRGTASYHTAPSCLVHTCFSIYK